MEVDSMKKSLLMVVTLLAVASLMAAMAFTSATVNNTASFKVSNTNEALLALEAGDHAAAGYTDDAPGSKELVINWAKGNGGEFGVQSGSIYYWNKLFKVTNNSEKTVHVSISVPIDSAKPEPNIGSKVFIKTADSENWVTVASRHTGAYGNKVTFTLAPGEFKWIDSKIDSIQRTLANKTNSFNLLVEAKAVDITPVE